MTEKQKQLVKDYGPKFLERSYEIKNEFLYLPADAISVLTDSEWKPCADRLVEFLKELNKVELIVKDRLKEIGVSVE